MQAAVVRANKNEEDLELSKVDKKSDDDDGWGSKNKEKPINTLQLLSQSTLLKSVIEFTTSLESHLPNSILTHALSVKLYHFQNKPALALRSLKKGLELLEIASPHTGFFVGNAMDFLNDFNTNEEFQNDTTLQKFFDTLKIPSPEKLACKINKKDIKSLHESGVDLKLDDIKNSEQDFYVLNKIKNSRPDMAESITNLLEKFHI